RGDTLRVSAMPFDRSAEEALADELAAAAKADADAKQMDMLRDGALVLFVALLVAIAFWQQRRKAKQRALATSYLVEQLRNEPPRQPELIAPAAAVLALEANELDESQRLHDELVDLV